MGRMRGERKEGGRERGNTIWEGYEKDGMGGLEERDD